MITRFNGKTIEITLTPQQAMALVISIQGTVAGMDSGMVLDVLEDDFEAWDYFQRAVFNAIPGEDLVEALVGRHADHEDDDVESLRERYGDSIATGKDIYAREYVTSSLVQ